MFKFLIIVSCNVFSSEIGEVLPEVEEDVIEKQTADEREEMSADIFQDGGQPGG